MAAARPSDGYRAPAWVHGQLRSIVDFWHRNARDERHGGYVSQLLADGTVYDGDTKHLVADARFVVLFAIGAIAECGSWCVDAAARALEHLVTAHRDRQHGGYFWMLRGAEVADPRKQAYGHAFVVLAGATALKAGVPGAAELLADAVAVADERFFGASDLAVNTASRDWTEVSDYRGQNANMHMCEAFIAAYEATGDSGYLQRAYAIADILVRKTATRIGGFVWENYHSDWTPDWRYQVPDGMASRHGVMPGHQVEWAKLLGILARYHDAEWLLPQAVHLHRLAWDFGWDPRSGGFYNGLARDLSVTDPARSPWSPAEAIGSAAVLLAHTGNPDYWIDYDRAWAYAVKQLVDPDNGGWYTVAALPSQRQDHRKGDLFEPDYHPANACYEVLRSVGTGAGEQPARPSGHH